MDSAKHSPTNRVYFATEFTRLEPTLREELRERLVCPSCDASAYFVPPTRRGTSYFGARPHEPGCRVAAPAGMHLVRDIPQGEAIALDATIFKLRPNRPRGRGDRVNVPHDPQAEPGRGNAHRYNNDGGRGRNVASVGVRSLLTKLTHDPEFASSDQRIEINGRSDRIRYICVNASETDERDIGRKRLFWGSIHFARPARDGGAWLYTGYEFPNLLLNEKLLDFVLDDNDLDELDELAGATFLAYCYLNTSRDGGHTYFSSVDPTLFAVIPDRNTD